MNCFDGSDEAMTLKDQLMRDEGLRLKPYVDTRGKLTIGFGRNLTDQGITLVEADLLLDNDMQRHTAEVLALFAWMLGIDDVRREAFINMAFNEGAHGLLKSPKMLRAAEAGHWRLAAIELLNGPYHLQVGDRAYRLSRQLETGERV